MEVLIYVLPFFPNLGDYLTAVTSLFLPFCIYLFIKKLLSYDEKEVLKIHGLFIKIFMIITITFLIIIIILVSGIFKYKMIAIASDSMNPVYYRGDAIIYEKVSIDELQKNDILVFEYNNSVVTHRIINIIEEDGQKYFQTKGDNNEQADMNLVSMEDVLEQIIGDIRDEYDEEDEEVKSNDDGTYLVDARTRIDDFNKYEILPPIPDDEADTVGGFLFSYLGRLPKRNEAIEYKDYSFTVVGKSGNIVTKIRIEKLKKDNKEENTENYDDEE